MGQHALQARKHFSGSHCKEAARLLQITIKIISGVILWRCNPTSLLALAKGQEIFLRDRSGDKIGNSEFAQICSEQTFQVGSRRFSTLKFVKNNGSFANGEDQHRDHCAGKSLKCDDWQSSVKH
jgi:hypothetical protein